MDFEYDLNEEKERENAMEIVIDEMKIEIPETLVEERIKLIGITREDVQEMLVRQGKKYKECLLFNKKYNSKTFEQNFVAYLDSEMTIYRL